MGKSIKVNETYNHLKVIKKPKINKYVSYFYVNRKQIHVGSFNTAKEAYQAREKAIQIYQFE
ncbi:hypothetical protein [Staphylococcus hominis]|uniref:hypothetical protein n=1 Tax=Staphylococcus hominis TaxID=1290 RepID=UPI000D1F77F8|nr:hypothetical protein [Staphylococcus hominis]PTK37742.1 hypothetical protein BUZ45_03320 [Staphylococcus hominis]